MTQPSAKPPAGNDRLVDNLRSVGAADSLGGRLVLVRAAGAGGMGQVFEATDGVGGPRLAVKLIHELRDEAGLARFTAEAEILESLAHPAIVGYVGHGTTDEGDPYLAMGWLEGEDLSQRLSREPLSVVEAATLGARIAGGLAAAHAGGIVHRDLKPGNIVLVDGDVGRATIVDFGVARRPQSELTRTGQLVGTPGYMAPEQIRGPRRVSGSADLFALGCVLYQCLTGRLPFEAAEVMTVLAKLLLESAPRVRALRPEVPPRLDALIAQLLAKDDAVRPTAEEAEVELDAIGEALARGDEAALAVVRWSPRDTLAAADTVADPGAPERQLPEAAAAQRRRGRQRPSPRQSQRSRRRWRWTAAAALLAALPLAAAIALSVRNAGQRGAASSVCHSAAPPLDGAWNAEARRRVAAAFAAIAVPYADASRREVERRLDRYAADWVGAREETCLATRVRGAQPESVRLRRDRCLDDRSRAVRALVEDLADADATLAERAVRAVDGLPPVSGCLDSGESGPGSQPGAGAPAAPLRPDFRTAAPAATDPARDAIRSDLVLATVKLLAGRYREVIDATDGPLAAARALGDRHLEVEALLLRGRAARGASQLEIAIDALGAAAAAAGEIGDRASRVDALTRFGYALHLAGRTDEAARAVDQAEAEAAAATAPGAPPVALSFLADLENVRGALLGSESRFADALPHYERALALGIQAYGPDSLLLANTHKNVANALVNLDRPDEALIHDQRALALLRQQGDDHPDVARQRSEIGLIFDVMGRFNDARRELLEAIRSLRQLYGDNLAVAEAEKDLAYLLLKHAQMSESIEHARKALAIYRALAPASDVVLRVRVGLGLAMSYDHQEAEGERELRAALADYQRRFPADIPEIAAAHAQLGTALGAQQRYAEAAREMAEATRLYIQAYGEQHSLVAETLNGESRFQVVVGHNRKALALSERAWKINEAILPPDHPRQLNVGIDIARAQMNLGHPDKALPYAERAVAQFYGKSGIDTALAQWTLAVALWDLRREPDRAVALARSARNILRVVDPEGIYRHELQSIETWLVDKPT